MEDRRIPIEDVEEVVIDDIEEYGEYEATLCDENKVCVEVI